MGSGARQTVRLLTVSGRVALGVLLALSPVGAFAAEPKGVMIAQGGFEKLPDSVAPSPYNPNSPSSTSPRQDHNLDPGRGRGERSTSSSSSDGAWGALAFTADGS